MRKNFKKIVALLLVVLTLMGTAITATAATPPFSDITDSETQMYADVLRMMEVLDGVGNNKYNPTGSLTRAQFCKMAIVVMGRKSEEPAYRNRTIFKDVTSKHWARGYVNLAVSGENRIIQGDGTGNFRPDSKITYAQAITILIRVLGYTDADAGMLWPQGYVNLGADIGLTDGLTVSANSAITRADAAKLFYNLLGCEKKGGGKYIATLGTALDDVIVTNADAISSDGKGGAIGTSAGVFKSASGVVPESIVGKKGTLLTNADGKVITFLPDGGNDATITVAGAQYTYVTDSTGKKHEIPSGVAVYTASGKGTYADMWVDLYPGVQLTIFYNAAGIVEALYMGTSSTTSALVAQPGFTGNPFAALLGGETNYKIVKNGARASTSDIKVYDVGTYDANTKTLYVSDLKISGKYQNAYPNQQTPGTITMLGEKFSILPSAVDSASAFKIGDGITLLLTYDNQVAGVISSSVVNAAPVGVVIEASENSATIELLCGITVQGDPSITSSRAESILGELVTVSAPTAANTAADRIVLSSLSSGSSGTLDLKNNKLGSAVISAAAKVYERVGTSALVEISLDELVQSTIPASKIRYYHTDFSGKVDILILDDVTGDRYTYGILTSTKISGSFGDWTWENPGIYVKNPNGDTEAVVYAGSFAEGAAGGVVSDISDAKASSVLILKSATSVPRSAFSTSGGKTTYSYNGLVMPVSDDVVCYNKAAGVWFSSLAEARAFSDSLTVYYDKDPADGGKIRVVIAG